LVVEAQVSGAAPGAHGIHIHEGKSCEDPKGHFNPTNTIHGRPNTRASHVGDLGNILTVLDGTGFMRVAIWNRNARRFGGWDAILGKPIVLHKNRDNHRSQPAGNSGPPIACGIIEKVISVAE
jgi:Cu-Zn family superoxide dismutase